MKLLVYILALGALATTASASWFFPQAQEDRHRDPHHPSHYPTPHTSHPPTRAHGVAHVAQSSSAHRRPCHGHGSPSNYRQSTPGSMLDSLRLWLAEHDLMHYRPFTPPSPRPIHHGTPIWTQTKTAHQVESGEIITRITWHDPIFVDTDPSVPLSADEMRVKISEMIQHPSARGGYLLPMTSGSIRVVTSGPGFTHTREYYPASGRKDGDFRIPMTAGFFTSDSDGRRPYHAQYLEVNAEDDDDAVAQRIQAAIDEAQRSWREDPALAPEGTYITGKGDKMDKDATLRRIEELLREGDAHGPHIPTSASIDESEKEGGRTIAPVGEKKGRPPGPGWARIRTGITASGKTIKLPMPIPMFPRTDEEPAEDGRVWMSDGEVRIISAEWVRQEEAHRQVQGQGHPHGHEHRPHPGHQQQGSRPCGGHSGWHHRRPSSIDGRIHRAMHRLHPAESLALTFVLGAGLGSILHMLFMITLLLTRRIRCGRLSEEERRVRRAARCERGQADPKGL